MACGMIFVILVCGIDFSIGSMSALGCVIVAMHMSKHGIGAGGFIVSLLIALATAVVLGIIPVSYTHLDVYKRQDRYNRQ